MRIIIADDHTLVRAGVRRLVDSFDGCEVVAEAQSARDTLDLAARLRPDLILLDLCMPDGNGIEVIAGVRRASPETEPVRRGAGAQARSRLHGRVDRHLAIVAVLLLLLIGPIFGPVPDFLGEQFGIETAVIIMLFTFVAGFGIILTVILGFSEMRADSLREKLGRLGWGQPSRLAAIIVAVIAGLAWGALFLSTTLQFDPDKLAELSLFRLAAILIAVFGAIQEDLITRGYVMNGLRQINIPNWGQLVVSALLFALYHTIWGFNVFSFIFSLIFGLILGGLFLGGKRSLTPVLVAHLLPVIISEPFSSMLIFLAPGA